MQDAQVKKTLYEGYLESIIMVFSLSNRFTNPIMFGIILKGYFPSMLDTNFITMISCRHKLYYCKYIYCLYTGKRTASVASLTFYHLKRVQNIKGKIRTFFQMHLL